MPHTNCQAFQHNNGEPCGARLRPQLQEDGYCGRHNYHLNRHAGAFAVERFNRQQAVLRDAWNARQAGQAAGPPPAQPLNPVEGEPLPGRPICVAVLVSGIRCNRTAAHADWKCSLHHSLDVRRAEDAPRKLAEAEVKRIYRQRANDWRAAVDAYVAAQRNHLTPRCFRQLFSMADDLILREYRHVIADLLDARRTRDEIDAWIRGHVATGAISDRRAEILEAYADHMILMREMRLQWAQNHPQQHVQRFGPNQREAQLAADSQNVHTHEISKQMRDAMEILIAVDVPPTQLNTIDEIVASWRTQGRPDPEIGAVRRDVVDWWNRKTIFKTDDKMYKKVLRGLWWTIKQYKGELRTELEKRLWDECRDACVPYSVCTQGHMARLSNVMVGFDDAFVPPVPVGEILQQKMAAIFGMEVAYEKQIELAEGVLAELKIPVEEHSNWLSAF